MQRFMRCLAVGGFGILLMASAVLACGGGHDGGPGCKPPWGGGRPGCPPGCKAPHDGLLGDVLGLPLIVFDSTGTTAFDSTAGLLTVEATALALKYDGIDILLPIGSAKVHIRLKICDCDGRFRGLVCEPELVLEGTVDVDDDGYPEYQGVLLTGDIAAFGFENTDSTTDLFDFRFRVTGGQMAGVFGAQVGVQVTAEHSTFAGTFCEDFQGGAKGTVGAIAGQKCPRSPGYWKTHPCGWPTGSLAIGGETYDRGELLLLLWGRTPDGERASNDLSVQLARVLIAAKLSLLAGADPDDIVEIIVLADAFLAANPPGSDPDDPEAEALKDTLDAYVNSCGPCGGKPQGGYGGSRYGK